MNLIELFELWAPAESLWSQWAKPTAFLNTPLLDPSSVEAEDKLPQLSFETLNPRGTAVVVNMPAAKSVYMGLALAQIGFRPVPLFNAAHGPNAVVNMAVVTRALQNGADLLNGLHITGQAAPAFLIDSQRMGSRTPAPGDFDNRWIVFPQDLPSGTFLQSHAIHTVLLIQSSASLDEDLGHVLSLWKRSGLKLLRSGPGPVDSIFPLETHEIRSFDLLRAAFMAKLMLVRRLRRANSGGFGAVVPTPNSSGFG